MYIVAQYWHGLLFTSDPAYQPRRLNHGGIPIVNTRQVYELHALTLVRILCIYLLNIGTVSYTHLTPLSIYPVNIPLLHCP